MEGTKLLPFALTFPWDPGGRKRQEIVWIHIFHFCAFIAVGDDLKIYSSECQHSLAPKLLLAT